MLCSTSPPLDPSRERAGRRAAISLDTAAMPTDERTGQCSDERGDERGDERSDERTVGYAEDLRDYEEGWSLYEARRFFDAHEAWERLWLRSVDPERRFVQGLIQLTAGCHLLFEKQRRGGGLANLRKASRSLSLALSLCPAGGLGGVPGPSGCFGEDVPALLGAIGALLDAAARAGAGAALDPDQAPRRKPMDQRDPSV